MEKPRNQTCQPKSTQISSGEIRVNPWQKKLRGPSLIHPSRFSPAVSLAIVIRRNVVPMLIEVNLPVVLLHIDFKFPRRPPPLPPVIRIPHLVVALADSQRSAASSQNRCIPNVARAQS